MNLCKDCKHAREGCAVVIGFSVVRRDWDCMHPDMREPVHGEPEFSCQAARAEWRRTPCGKDGKLWEPGVPAKHPLVSDARREEEYNKPAEPGDAVVYTLPTTPRKFWEFWK